MQTAKTCVLPTQQRTRQAQQLQLTHRIVAATFFDLKMLERTSRFAPFSPFDRALLSRPPALSILGLCSRVAAETHECLTLGPASVGSSPKPRQIIGSSQADPSAANLASQSSSSKEVRRKRSRSGPLCSSRTVLVRFGAKGVQVEANLSSEEK